MFRPLKENEIEVRVARVTDKGVFLLLYKDARCDMNILDETVGPLNWKREHSRDNANCTVSLWDDKKSQWVGKEDTGSESNTEAAKGLASDSFKRACVNLGIGRELYTAPMVWVSADKYDKFDRHRVSVIGYDSDRNIVNLIIEKQTGETVYSWKKK